MTDYTILLEDGTVGSVSSDTIDGKNPLDFDEINVHLRDENGNPVEILGRPVEVLETN